MGKKVKQALVRLKTGGFHLPSPQEVIDAMTPAGAWTAKQLAEWGVKWPPKAGWRADLERRWLIANPDAKPRNVRPFPPVPKPREDGLWGVVFNAIPVDLRAGDGRLILTTSQCEVIADAVTLAILTDELTRRPVLKVKGSR